VSLKIYIKISFFDRWGSSTDGLRAAQAGKVTAFNQTKEADTRTASSTA
jgi:hypothetical protein